MDQELQERSWLFINRLTPAFDKGLRKFIEYAKQFRNREGKIKCPCRKCCNTKSQSLGEVYEHCFDWGWSPGYTTWFYHGETKTPEVSRKRSRTTQVVVEDGDKMALVKYGFLGRASEEEVLQTEEDDNIDEQDDDDLQETRPPSPPKRKQGDRGSAKGLKVQALKKKLNGPIPIIWDPRFPKVRKAVGQYSVDYDSELGKIVRKNVPVYTENWSHVTQEQKDLIWSEAKSSFDPMEECHRSAVMTQSSCLFRKWKARCRSYADLHAAKNLPGPPPKFDDVDCQDDWDQFLRHIATPEFIAKSNRNKINRAKLRYVGTQGRRSMPQHRWKKLTMNNLNQLEEVDEDPIEVWADKHKRNGKFVNAEAEADYRKVVEVATRLAPDGLLTYELEMEIFRVALGPRRDYVKGLGPTQSSQSTTPLQSQGLSSSTRNFEHIERLERQLKKQHKKFEAKFERLMSTLKAHIPGLPDIIEDSSDDNEDTDSSDDNEDIDSSDY